MQALLVSVGTAGDVLPMIALGEELLGRGYDVAFASAQTFEGPARRAGLDFEPLMSHEDYLALFEHPDFWRPIKGARLLFSGVHDLMRPAYEFIARRLKPGETVALASSLAIGAKVARDRLKLPLITVHLSPVMVQSRHAAPIVPGLLVPQWLPDGAKWWLQMGSDKYFTSRLLQPGLNAFRAELGLRPVGRVRHWWNSPRRVFLMFPDWFCPPQPDWPDQATQYGFPRADRFGGASGLLDQRLADFLAAGDPPVAITFSSARMRTHALYKAAVDGCMRLGKRAIVLTEQPFTPPAGCEDRVHVGPYAPLSMTLPHCAALVHHGGVGTVATAFAAGKPQLVVPLAFDQFDNAARVERLGCGARVSRHAFTGRRAARELAALASSPEIADRCAEFAARSAARDEVSRACDGVEAQFRRLRRLKLARAKRPAAEQRR